VHCNCLTSVGMSLMYPPSCVYTLDETYMSFWLPFAPTLVLCALRVLCVYEEAACVQTSRTLLVFTPMNPCSSPVKILDLPEYICTESFTIYFRRIHFPIKSYFSRKHTTCMKIGRAWNPANDTDQELWDLSTYMSALVYCCFSPLMIHPCNKMLSCSIFPHNYCHFAIK
jgi:hypothetical protein